MDSVHGDTFISAGCYTVKPAFEEPGGLRICWQKFAILIPQNTDENLFSQARSSWFLSVGYRYIIMILTKEITERYISGHIYSVIIFVS